MKSSEKEKDPLPRLKGTIGLILGTSVVVSGAWGFFFYRTSALKDEQIALLEKRNADQRGSEVAPEAIRRLEARLIPLGLAFPMDPLNGRVKVGIGMESPTEVTALIIKAEQLRNEKKFDLAGAKLSEIDRIYPEFSGTPFYRFLIERDKGNAQEAFALAEQAIRRLPQDNRVLDAYEFAIKMNLQEGNRSRAEDLCLTAIRMDAQNDKRREFFRQTFGYEPSIP